MSEGSLVKVLMSIGRHIFWPEKSHRKLIAHDVHIYVCMHSESHASGLTHWDLLINSSSL
jgi:hypothetical protein